MTYTRAPFPSPLFKKLKATANRLGYTKKASHWKLLDFLLDYAGENETIFRNRS